MDNSKTLVYDGSFNGFLSAIYMAFDQKINVADIQCNRYSQNGLFSDPVTIFTQVDEAQRVWNAIEAKSHGLIKNIYFAYLSAYEGIEQLLYDHIRTLFSPQAASASEFSEGIQHKIEQLAYKVGREKQRLEASLGFQLTKDEVCYAVIASQYDVLPLISRHFRSRMRDQPWIIFDIKRNYGLYYNLDYVEFISLDPHAISDKLAAKGHHSKGEEATILELWSTFFESSLIKSHIRAKLHPTYTSKSEWSYRGAKRAV